MVKNRSLPSASQHTFAEVPRATMPRSVFVSPVTVKTAFNAGDLIPIFSDEVLPGDTFRLDSQLFGRLSTLLHPYMDNVYLETFYFFVPNRILWDDWEKFCGQQTNPGDSTDFTIPQILPPTEGFPIASLPDYFGFPPEVPNASMNALYLRAYNRIYNEYFRDQNLQDSIFDPTISADYSFDGGSGNRYSIRKRGKRHDYFTSCLPFPQKGPSVSIPLVGNAPVIGTGISMGLTDGVTQFGLTYGDNAARMGAHTGASDENVRASGTLTGSQPSSGAYLGLSSDPDFSGLVADMSDVSAVDMNAFRQAYSLQRFLEKDARGGTRYFEILNAHYGVTSPDSRMQRPEYLGGGSTRINVNTVAQTSETSEDGTPLGELAGFATIAPSRHGFIKSFVEHGVVIGLASVRADLTYQQGIERRFSRLTRYDYYWPAFAQLGEQAVLNKEIFAQGTSADDDVFGYQERYGEYRYKPSMVTGVMRSIAPQSLDTWHLAQDFESLPVLGDDFIQDSPPLDRVLAVQSSEQPQVILDCFHRLKCARPMPLYGVPALGDRF